MNMSPSREVHSTDVMLYVVSLGVSGAVVVLIVAAAIVIICLRQGRIQDFVRGGAKPSDVRNMVAISAKIINS